MKISTSYHTFIYLNFRDDKLKFESSDITNIKNGFAYIYLTLTFCISDNVISLIHDQTLYDESMSTIPFHIVTLMTRGEELSDVHDVEVFPNIFIKIVKQSVTLFWSRLKACGMCMQCINVHDDQPTQRLLLKANSCNMHCATCWWLKTGQRN